MLIAVKSEIITDLLVSSLSMHDVRTCDTGPGALAMLETLHPEVLILDLRLSGMDGITVLQKVYCKPPVILALTDLITEHILEEGVKAGIQDVLLSPCTIHHIIEHLNALIEKAPSADR